MSDRLQRNADCIKVAILDFVTFLALNDLLKIREQMTEVAVCLVDENPEIRGNVFCLTLNFFC